MNSGTIFAIIIGILVALVVGYFIANQNRKNKGEK